MHARTHARNIIGKNAVMKSIEDTYIIFSAELSSSDIHGHTYVNTKTNKKDFTVCNDSSVSATQATSNDRRNSAGTVAEVYAVV